MFDARRPLGWLLLLRPAMVALAVSAQTLPTTTISDTVYRADGTPSRRDAADFMAGVHHRRPGGSRRGQYQRHAGTAGALSVGSARTRTPPPQIRPTPSCTNWMIHCRQG
jgi:hypothetical protein